MSPSKVGEIENAVEKQNLVISEKHQLPPISVDQQSDEIFNENIAVFETENYKNVSRKISCKDQLSNRNFLVFVKRWMALVDSFASQECQNGNQENSMFKSLSLSDSKTESTSFLKRITKRNSHEKDKQAMSHGKRKSSKPNQRGTEMLDATGSKAKAGIDNQELIKIEMKPHPDTQEISSEDLLRFKVTMYNVKDKLAIEFDHQVEIDFVQIFLVKPVTKNACRSRRITKLLKRTTLTELEWEKGMHISGKQFAVSWISYKVPQIESENDKITENEMAKVDNAEYDDGCISHGKYERMFTVGVCQLELQIRLYKKVISLDVLEQTQDVLAACSCFTLYNMRVNDCKFRHV